MKKFILFIPLILLIIVNCNETKVLSPEDQVSQIKFSVNGLNDLGPDARYGVWAVYDSSTSAGPVSLTKLIGTFTIATDNEMFEQTFEVNLGLLQKSHHIVFSIEQADNIGANASAFQIIATELISNSGDFSIGAPYLLNFNFENARGYYLLDTPSDPAKPNPTSGIWFINKDTVITDITDTTGAVVDYDTTITDLPGLELPQLSGSWTYKAFVLSGGDTLSIGNFQNVATADLMNPYKGTAAGYPFPGEDFIRNAPDGWTFPIDLRGKDIVISLMPPVPDYSNIPFVVHPFMVTIPSNAQADMIYELDNNSDSFPGGMLTVEIELFD